MCTEIYLACTELIEEPIRATGQNFDIWAKKTPFRTSSSLEHKLVIMTE